MATSPARTSRLGIVLRVAAGLAVGAGLGEVAFRVRDHGAFPHLNLYAPDAKLGVKLMAGESMKLSFGGNPVTDVRINAAGIRGPELPPPGSDEVLVVGDSQVFGLGVEEGETFSAKLESMMPNTRVVNAGVPTYGPLEFEQVMAHLLEARKPKRVVYVVNLANDLFEAERPNTDRHAVWDGWAVRKETAPDRVVSFPGRDWLFRKSHAFFALRKWWYRKTGPTEAFSVPSEGTFKDISDAASRAAAEHQSAREGSQRLAKLREAKVGAANVELRAARDGFIDLAREEGIMSGSRTLEGYGTWDPLKTAFAQPGDIVGTDSTGESTGALFATAGLIVKGAEVRRHVEAQLREKARASAAAAAKIEPVLARIADAQTRTDGVRSEPVPRIRAWSPITPSLRRVKALCDAAGARLFVVALPLDVQVDKTEWKKYGTQAVDLEPAQILVEDIVDAAESVGATPLDLTGALRNAEPGAFLDHDIHLSPKGHEAVAKALAPVLSAPPTPKLPEPRAGRALGRTLPSSLATARSRAEVAVSGSTAAGCETYVVDEWLTLRCHHRGEDKAVPVGVRVVEAPLGEHAIYEDGSKGSPHALVIQVPLLRDQRTTVDLRWPTRTRRLAVRWGDGGGTVARSKDGNVNISMWGEVDKGADIPPPPKPREALCAAAKAAGVTTPCEELPLFDNPACFSTYRDPKAVLECLYGEREPACPRGTGPVGVFQRCLPLCSKEVPCQRGTCTPYEGAEVCL